MILKRNQKDWRKIRSEILERASYRCEGCGCHPKKQNALRVHHIDRDPRNNDYRNLIVLCWECHNLAHIFFGNEENVICLGNGDYFEFPKRLLKTRLGREMRRLNKELKEMKRIVERKGPEAIEGYIDLKNSSPIM